MIHKNKNYRMHQKERVINNRLRLMKQFEHGITRIEVSETGRLTKHRPYESCGSDHCFICSYKRYQKPWKRLRDDMIAQMELKEIENYDYNYLLGEEPDWRTILELNIWPVLTQEEQDALDEEFEGSMLLDADGCYKDPKAERDRLFQEELDFWWNLYT